MIFDKKITETIKMCRCCFMCRHACPVFLATKLDSHTPRGYAINLSRVNEGMADWGEEGMDRLFHCSQCGLCKELCAFHWPEDEMVLEGRREMVKAGREPERVREAIRTALRDETNDLFEPLRYDRKNAKILYIAGSALRNGQEEIIKSAAKVFEAADTEWTMMESEDTSGPVLHELGHTEQADIWLKALKRTIEKLNPEITVTSCAHTYSLLKKSGIEILHILEFAQLYFNADNINPAFERKRIMYHDPCHLGREFGIYDAPREIIKGCSGADVMEFHHSKNEAECCGAGASVDEVYPEIAQKVAKRRLEQAFENNVDIVVTACPICKKLFEKVSNEIRVLDITEFLAECIKNF